MPIFTQFPAKDASKRAVPQETIDEYKKFIEDLKEGNVGQLEFPEGEDTKLGKRALQEAGNQLGMHIKVSSARGQKNIVRFKRLSQEEFEEAQRKAKARGEKMRGKRRKK
jgi:hypothetical protein